MDLIDIYRTFYPTTTEYTLYSSVHENVSNTDHMQGHKTILSQFKKTDSLRPQWNKTGNQLQKEHPKPCKYIEIK